jgi:hypothetical protein
MMSISVLFIIPPSAAGHCPDKLFAQLCALAKAVKQNILIPPSLAAECRKSDPRLYNKCEKIFSGRRDAS